MRALADMDTIQIELTNACINSCSNCTRFCGHHEKPYFMDKDTFIKAIECMKDYPKMTGFMGGEPLLHPKFKEFCEIAQKVIPKNQLGLWTCLPQGFEHHSDIICDTFAHIFINDHSRDDIYHCPILVGIEEIFDDKRDMFYVADHCWLQNSWSAAINPNGAFFCEIAASMSLLFEDGIKGWTLESGWWKRVPKDYTEQIEFYCPRCGCAAPLIRRKSTDGKDDISPLNLERIKDRSRKVKRGNYVLSDLKLCSNPQQMAAYKDQNYRKHIASKYGIHLEPNEFGFLSPYKNAPVRREKSLFALLKENYDATKEKCKRECA